MAITQLWNLIRLVERHTLCTQPRFTQINRKLRKFTLYFRSYIIFITALLDKVGCAAIGDFQNCQCHLM